ncbi:hypothetical protein CKAH01_11419 [Colletotrichum kahawae]|uniref:Uncharacterized protein n=1 Tax=Colletotrichum kahawae TaxID=34407 RepID=A0AAD9YX16_COLKA|nr:hypothetical protein CKAH01_11419 [Colletotrichum kahawae]
MTNSEEILHNDYGSDNWLDEHHHTTAAESRPFRIGPDGSSEDTEISAIDIDDYHVICRNDIAAYLLSSRREAVGIQISQLKAAVWDENKWNRTLLSYCALRWSAVLLVEAAERLQHLEYESFAAYPGIILMTTDKIESVIDSSYEAIDVVVDLEKFESSQEHKLLRSKSGKLCGKGAAALAADLPKGIWRGGP